jgi:sterol desaturase/sphingolipid hydroxylase (fatty acid hydroxylase superfamily)
MISFRRNYVPVSQGVGVSEGAAVSQAAGASRTAGLKTLPRAVAGAFLDRNTRGSALAVTMALPVVALTLPALLRLLVSPGSTFSAFSLTTALIIAATAITLRRIARGRRTSFKLLRRAMFPRWLMFSASTRADIGFWLLNTMATGMMIGWAALSFPAVAKWTSAVLVMLLGPQPAPWLAPPAVAAIQTFAMFLAYELAYWLDHYLSHEIPFLWEFHRVHHTAETLSPITVFRVHPIDSLVFYNIMVLIMAPTSAIFGFLLGTPGHDLTLDGTNVIVLTYIFTTFHLQHSHIWIAFTGTLGRIFASPAHHQIHHSSDPDHFGRNLGAGLAVFDWLFGTLRIPRERSECLTFGVEPSQHAPHTIAGGLITPFVRAFRMVPGRRLRIGSPGLAGVRPWQPPEDDLAA